MVYKQNVAARVAVVSLNGRQICSLYSRLSSYTIVMAQLIEIDRTFWSVEICGKMEKFLVTNSL